jgi:hypothetical protein
LRDKQGEAIRVALSAEQFKGHGLAVSVPILCKRLE